MQKQIYTQGQTVPVIVPAGGYLAVWAKGEARIYQNTVSANFPPVVNLIQALNGQIQQTNPPAYALLGPYATGASLSIENTSGAIVYYDAGLAPVLENMLSEVQVTPGTLDATGPLTGLMMATGLITSTTAAAVAGTLPTGAVMETNSLFNINDAFEWTVINTGAANAFTVTASAGHTIVGNAVVALSSSGNFKTRKTAASTFVTYRIG